MIVSRQTIGKLLGCWGEWA